MTPELAKYAKTNSQIDISALSAQIESFTTAVSESIVRELTNLAVVRHQMPLLNIISSMSISELAELAESMVELESLKEKISRASESVGGPTDVVAITKNEGLVWIKRKHYFEKALNPRYFKTL